MASWPQNQAITPADEDQTRGGQPVSASIALYRLTPESSGATLCLDGGPGACAALLANLMPKEVHHPGNATSENATRTELVRLTLLDTPAQDPSGCVWSIEAWVAWEAWMVRMNEGAKAH